MESNLNQAHNTMTTGTMFGRLSPEALADLMSLQFLQSRPGSVAVFSEKEPSHGLYIVLEGEVRLSVSATDGRRLSLRIARKGDVLGLSAVLSGIPYDVTAETLYPARLAHIGRHDFLGFLTRHPEAYQAVIEQLSRDVSMACCQLRTVGLASSAPEKLARLLLDWSEANPTTEGACRMRFSLTHEEIGEFIGASRETVTRTLSVFKLRKLVTFQGSMITIPNRAALADFARA